MLDEKYKTELPKSVHNSLMEYDIPISVETEKNSIFKL